jgi:hypothetical protein
MNSLTTNENEVSVKKLSADEQQTIQITPILPMVLAMFAVDMGIFRSPLS